MTDSGLSTRLRQQSRRAGLMVGITMVLAIAICIFGAAGLFAWLSRPFSDLIPVVAPAAQIQPSGRTSRTVRPTTGSGEEPAIEAQAEPTQPAPAAPTDFPDRRGVRAHASDRRRPVGQFPHRALHDRFGDRCPSASDAAAVPGRRRADRRIRVTAIAGCASAPKTARKAGSGDPHRAVSAVTAVLVVPDRSKKASNRRCNVC